MIKDSNAMLYTVDYHILLPLIFTPAEQIFIMHMINIEKRKEKGLFVPMGRSAHMKQMQLTQYAFDKCIYKMTQLGLLAKRNNKKKNRVYYCFDIYKYAQLIKIISGTENLDKLKEFCHKNFIIRIRSIDSISDQEIKNLKMIN